MHTHTHVWQMKRELGNACGQHTLAPNVVVGVFLVREGARIDIKNKLGIDPLALHPQNVVDLIKSYSDIAGAKLVSCLLCASLSPSTYLCVCVQCVHVAATEVCVCVCHVCVHVTATEVCVCVCSCVCTCDSY